MTGPASETPPERPAPAGVRRSMGLLALVAVVVTLAPGLAAYLVLRALGAPIGLAGVVGLLLFLVANTAFAGWLFSGPGSGAARRARGSRP